MDLNEFKAWFDGFCEGRNSALSAEDVKIVQAKLENITVTSQPVTITYPQYPWYSEPIKTEPWTSSGTTTTWDSIESIFTDKAFLASSGK